MGIRLVKRLSVRFDLKAKNIFNKGLIIVVVLGASEKDCERVTNLAFV